jgi:hypothetical protein
MKMTETTAGGVPPSRSEAPAMADTVRWPTSDAVLRRVGKATRFCPPKARLMALRAVSATGRACGRLEEVEQRSTPWNPAAVGVTRHQPAPSVGAVRVPQEWRHRADLPGQGLVRSPALGAGVGTARPRAGPTGAVWRGGRRDQGDGGRTKPEKGRVKWNRAMSATPNSMPT